MNTKKQKLKLKLVQQHRQVWYERTLDRLISGTAHPAGVTYRYNKLKEVK
jgi:hypothetical protein